MEKTDGNALWVGQGKKRLICSVHGDIGGIDGPEGNMALCFTKSNHYYCFYCIEDLLMKAISPCEIKDG